MALTYERRTNRQKDSYIEITGYEGNVRLLRIPSELDGLCVRSIGDGAFRRREDITEVWLPETVAALGRYAFYSCKNIRALHLCDGVEDYCDGVIKQCRSLERIELTLTRGRYAVMRDMLADCDRKLTFLLAPMGARLTFPAYVYDFVEDVEARVLHHKIEGSGYPYRECVTRGGVNYAQYDRLFGQAVDDDEQTAAEIALGRLMCGYELGEESRRRYEDYLRAGRGGILEALIRGERAEEIHFLCASGLIGEKEIEKALFLAAGQKAGAIAAELMEYRHAHFAHSGTALFLDDW